MTVKDSWSSLFTASIGAAVALLGAFIIGEWLAGTKLLIQLHPAYGSLKFNNAVAYLFLGLGLLGFGAGRKRLAVAGGAVGALIGAITLAQYLTGNSFGIDELLVKDRFPSQGRPPGMMSPSTCWALLASGAGLIYAGLSRPHAWRDLTLQLSALFTIGLGLSALISRALDPEEGLLWWGRIEGMSLQSACVLVFLGGGLLACAWQRVRETTAELMPKWWPLLVGSAILVLTFVQWTVVQGSEEKRTESLLKSETDKVLLLIEAGLGDRVNALERQKRRYEISQGLNLREWDHDAENYLAHYPAFIAMMVTDTAMKPLRIRSRPDRPLDASHPVDICADCSKTMKEAVLADSPALLFPGEVPDSGPVMYIANPLLLKGRPAGWLLAVVDVRKLVTEEVGFLRDRVGFQLKFAGARFNISPPGGERPHPLVSLEAEGKWYMGRWTIEAWLQPEYASQQRSPVGQILLAVGIVLAALLTFSLRSAQEVRRHSIARLDAGRKLREEAEERVRAQESLGALFKVSRLLISSLDPEQVMDMVAAEAASLIGAGSGLAGLRCGDELRSRSVHTPEGMVQQAFLWTRGMGAPGWVLSHRKPYHTDNGIADPQVLVEFKERFQPGPLICMPLLDKAEAVIGFIQVFRRSGEPVFTDDEQENLRALAGIASTAVQNAIAYDRIWRTETELRKAARRYAVLAEEQNLMLENAADFIFRHDEKGVITYISRSIEKATGHSVDELKGHFNRFLSSHPINEDVDRHKQEALTTGRPVPPYLAEIVRKDGSLMMVEVNEQPYLEKGRVTGLIGVARDVTERQKLQEQLSHSQKMDAVGQLAGGVAHDFNNILTVIMGFSDFLLEGLPPGDRGRRDLEQIRQAAQRGADLTGQLLAFTRKQVIQPRAVNLNEEVKSLRKMLDRLVTEKIELVVEAGAPPWLVYIDPTQVQQLLMNLAANARDAMPDGGELRISVENVALGESDVEGWSSVEPGECVRLRVRDNGMGMAKQVQARVFEPFFTTKPLGKGTGLGLATCWGILKQNGGHIAIESEVGRGTVVDIFLPRFEASGEGWQPPDVENNAPRGGETVLIAEDEPSLRNLLALLLRGLGYRVLQASNGEEALAIAERIRPEPIHALVTDLVMPRMNGKVLSEKLSAVHPGVRVIFMSGYADSLLDHFGEIDEKTPFLQKPFTRASISQKVREVLDAPQDQP